MVKFPCINHVVLFDPVAIVGDETQNWKWACRWRWWWRGANRVSRTVTVTHMMASHSNTMGSVTIVLVGWQGFEDKFENNLMQHDNHQDKRLGVIFYFETTSSICRVGSGKSILMSVNTWQPEVSIPNMIHWTRLWIHKTNDHVAWCWPLYLYRIARWYLECA